MLTPLLPSEPVRISTGALGLYSEEGMADRSSQRFRSGVARCRTNMSDYHRRHEHNWEIDSGVRELYFSTLFMSSTD